MTAWHNGDQLVQAVASINPNTIVVVHSVGPLILEPWIENPNVTAVLWAGVSGPETGNAVTDVLYGAVNPSGRLSLTFPKKLEDVPSHGHFHTENGTVRYAEDLYVGYKHYHHRSIAPLYHFG